MKTKQHKTNKVNVVTLGCSKNLVDSEVLMNQLRGNDIEVAHESDEDDSNIVVVNTCGFIDVAKQESIDTILHYAQAKTAGQIDKLYVTGCLSQRYKERPTSGHSRGQCLVWHLRFAIFVRRIGGRLST